MKKLILIAACLGLMALGYAGNAEAYTQWEAGETASFNINIPSYFDITSALLSISAINPMGNDHVKVNGNGVGFLDVSPVGVLTTTKLDITNFFATYPPNGQPLNITIDAGGPLSLSTYILDLKYELAGSFGDLPNGNNTAPVPEPATLLLLGSGLSGLAFWGKRRRAV
jgi:hypothetical protein